MQVTFPPVDITILFTCHKVLQTLSVNAIVCSFTYSNVNRLAISIFYRLTTKPHYAIYSNYNIMIMGPGGFEPPMYLTSRIYSPLASPICIETQNILFIDATGLEPVSRPWATLSD